MSNNNSITIRDLQKTILEIMLEINRICIEKNILYFIDGGTCLGAIRHKGFIPWDDDADIAMLRDDYDRFVNLCKNENILNKEYEIQCYETDNHYSDGFIRIRKRNTLCVVNYHKERGYKNLGVFVDVFPLDYSYTNDRKKLIKRKKKIDSITKCLVNKLSKTRTTFLSKLNYLRLKFISTNKLLKKRQMLEKKYSKKDKNYIVHTYSSYPISRAVFPYSIYQTPLFVSFEENQFYCVSNPDLYLKIVYGNYMEMPPLEKRVAHLPLEIKL